MSVESPADRLSFLNPDEFGVAITYESGTIYGIWLTESDVFTPGDTEITANRPAAIVRTADVPTLDSGTHPKTLKSLIYDGKTWLITSWYDDGTGMIILYMERPIV